MAEHLPSIRANLPTPVTERDSNGSSGGSSAIPVACHTSVASRTTKVSVEIGQFNSAIGACGLGRSQYPSSQWQHTYGSVAVEVQPGVWDFLPSLPSWTCMRIVHDESYLVRGGCWLPLQSSCSEH